MASSSGGGSPDVETPGAGPVGGAGGREEHVPGSGAVPPADAAADGASTSSGAEALPTDPVDLATATPRRRHAALVYTGLRLLLLLVTLGVVWLLGARGWLWLALGFVVSGLLSLVLLSRQRDDMSIGVAGVFGRINDRIEASRRAEDDLDADDTPA